MLRSTALGFSWHSRRGRSHPQHRAFRARRQPRPRTKTLVWRRAPGSCVPLPAHCQSAGTGWQPRLLLLPGGSSGEKLHARSPPPRARRARPASCQPAGEGRGEEGGTGWRAGPELWGRGARVPTRPCGPLLQGPLFAFGCTGGTTLSWLGRENAGVKGGKRMGIGHLGTLKVRAVWRAPLKWVPASSPSAQSPLSPSYLPSSVRSPPFSPELL